MTQYLEAQDIFDNIQSFSFTQYIQQPTKNYSKFLLYPNIFNYLFRYTQLLTFLEKSSPAWPWLPVFKPLDILLCVIIGRPTVELWNCCQGRSLA